MIEPCLLRQIGTDAVSFDVLVLVTNRSSLGPTEKIDKIAHAETLSCSIHRTESFLSDDRAVKTFDFFRAVVTVAAVVRQVLRKISKQKFSAAGLKVTVLRHRVELF